MGILGLIAHQVLEEASGRPRGSEFDAEKIWSQLVENANKELQRSWLEARLYPLQSTAQMYEVIRNRTWKRAAAITPPVGRKAPGKSTRRRGIGYELWVESRDKTVGGWIDTAERIDGEIVLSDLKAGDLLEPQVSSKVATLKEAYALQLKLYAALYQETFGEWPSTIRIVPLTGSPSVIGFSADECRALLAEASKTLRDINARIFNGTQSARDIAAPSPTGCRFCGFRPSCHAYQLAPKKKNEEWPVDVLGQVWDINILRDGKINLRVSTSVKTEAIFRALSPGRHPALKAIQRGDHVGIFNARVCGHGTEFSEGTTTVLYKFAESFRREC